MRRFVTVTLVTNIGGRKRYVCWRRSRVGPYVALLPNPERAANLGDLGVQLLTDLPNVPVPRPCIGYSRPKSHPPRIKPVDPLSDTSGLAVNPFIWSVQKWECCGEESDASGSDIRAGNDQSIRSPKSRPAGSFGMNSATPSTEGRSRITASRAGTSMPVSSSTSWPHRCR